MGISLAAVGFTSIIAQLIFMRELVATFYGNELLFGLVLMAWLAWVAAGAWGTVRLAKAFGVSVAWRMEAQSQLGAKVFAAGLALAGVMLPGQIALVRGARELLGVTPGALVEFGPMVATAVLLLAPVCLLTGFLFTWGARLMVEGGKTGGQAYVWESLGAVAGGTLFSFALVHWLNSFQTVWLVGATDLTVAVYLLKSRKEPTPSALSVMKLGALLLVLSATGLPVGRFLHDSTLRWQWSDLAFAADSPYGRLIVQARDGQRIFFENGLLAFETQGTFPEEVVHFSLLAHPDPRNVLLIGGGVAGDVREALKHPITRMIYVELDPLLIEAARLYLPSEDAAALSDPRLNVVLSDGRLYVKQAADANQSSDHPATLFDVIILDLPEPATGALNRFYTREFFAEVQAIMNPGGIFTLGLPSAENYWSPELARRNGSVFHTLRAVFGQVLVLPGEHNFFLASDTPLEADPASLAERLAGRGIATRWLTPDYIQYVFTTDRFTAVRRELEALKGVRLNRDMTPICYYYDLALWLSRFYPQLRGAYPEGGLATTGANLNSLGWEIAPLALGVALARWQRRWAVPMVVAGVGLAGMILEVVTLFAFQVLHGYVYAEVSLIVTAFMAGLALGAAGSNWLLGGWFPTPERRARWALICVQLAMGVYGGAFALLLWVPIPVPAPLFPLLALLGGMLGGMAFPLALVLVDNKGNAGHTTGLLYAADLVGGCLGALLGTALLVPLLGIPHTYAMIALVALACLLALV